MSWFGRRHVEQERSDPARIAAALDAARAGRSNVKLPDSEVRAIYETGENARGGHRGRGADDGDARRRADQQLPTETVVTASTRRCTGRSSPAMKEEPSGPGVEAAAPEGRAGRTRRRGPVAGARTAGGRCEDGGQVCRPERPRLPAAAGAGEAGPGVPRGPVAASKLRPCPSGVGQCKLSVDDT